MSTLGSMQALGQALSGKQLTDKVAEAAQHLEERFGSKTARGLMGNVGHSTFAALKSGTASQAQMEKAITGLVSVKDEAFRRQLVSKAKPAGIGKPTGGAAVKSSPSRKPGEKYRDFYGRLRTELDTPHLDLPPVKQPDNTPLTGRDDHGRRLRDEQFEKEQREQVKRDLRRATGQRLTD